MKFDKFEEKRSNLSSLDVYNKFKDTDRSSLGPLSLFNYLYVNINMPSLEEFDPRPATEFWLKAKKRQPHSNKRSRKQNWFKGVFKDAGMTYVSKYKVQF